MFPHYNEFDELKRTIEKWQIVSDKPSIRYAVGAMQNLVNVTQKSVLKLLKELKNN